MLRIEDVVEIPDSDMGPICQMLPVDTLAKALQTAPAEVVEKFLKNIPATPARLIRDLMEKHKNLTDDDIRSAREKIVGIVAKMHAG